MMAIKETNKVVILAAGKPHSNMEDNKFKSTYGASSVIGWMLRAVAFLEPEIHLVDGYNNSRGLRKNQPKINFWHNAEWASTGPVWSLLKVPFFANEAETSKVESLTITYSDIAFREEAVKKLLEKDTDIVVAVDTKWRKRYSGRTQEDIISCEKVTVFETQITRLGSDIDPAHASAEFIGLAHFSHSAIKFIADLVSSDLDLLRTANLSSLIEILRTRGMRVTAVDIDGEWAELNDPSDLAKFVLGTKAQTLSRLYGVLNHGQIEEQISFTAGEWQKNPQQIVARIRQRFLPAPLIVRSSALGEDSFSGSMAGVHESILNVDITDENRLISSINKVIQSYSRNHLGNEILIQPMLKDVILSGVAFTRTLSSGAPYIVVNYDDETGNTESVTGGLNYNLKTLFIRRDRAINSTNTPTNIVPLLKCLFEIEKLLNYNTLDVEFAITKDHGLHILQVRPMVVEAEALVADEDVQRTLNTAEAAFVEKQVALPWIKGSRTIFGVMPDWNPAEIIGKRPNPLALSLYCDVICNDVWAAQRAEYGYRDIRPHPLLMSFAGHPYVDVRASLNSFVPADVSDLTTEKIVSFALALLEKKPELHDKIEFDIIPTCLALDKEHWQAILLENASFTIAECEELWDGLLKVTRKGMSRVSFDLDQINVLEQRFIELKRTSLPPLVKAFALLDDLKRFGTLAFAHLARNGFVAMTLLRSAVATGTITNEEKDDFLLSIKTVSHALADDAIKCYNQKLSWDEFVDRYGHLRPGTYDVTSPSYRENSEQYLRPLLKQPIDPGEQFKSSRKLWDDALPRLAKAMGNLGLTSDADFIEKFLCSAIEGREYAKFVFTKNLSLALDIFAKWGENRGLTRNDLAMLDLNELRLVANNSEMCSDSTGTLLNSRLLEQIKIGYHNLDISTAIELPPLLCNPDDFHVFHQPVHAPNFVGSKNVTAKCIEIKNSLLTLNVKDCIIIIPSADPGYDWLFAQGISGLITMYGGANSHMAIRAAEFDLPSAIGVGPGLYKTLVNAATISIDPRNQFIRIVS